MNPTKRIIKAVIVTTTVRRLANSRAAQRAAERARLKIALAIKEHNARFDARVEMAVVNSPQLRAMMATANAPSYLDMFKQTSASDPLGRYSVPNTSGEAAANARALFDALGQDATFENFEITDDAEHRWVNTPKESILDRILRDPAVPPGAFVHTFGEASRRLDFDDSLTPEQRDMRDRLTTGNTGEDQRR